MARREGLFARLSLDYADHPKIAVLSDEAFRAHVEMILYSRKYMTDGQIAKQIAKRWPQQALSELQANDTEAPSLLELDSGDYLLHGFEDMQETKQEIEAKRQVRAEAGRKGGRAKKQNAKPAPSKTPSKVSSNLLSKNVAEIETESETELSNKPPVSPPGDNPQPKPTSRKTRIPDDWAPNESHEAKAAELGVDLHAETEKFRDHAIANGKTFVDWSRGFHTWLNNAPKFAPRPGSRPSERDSPRTFGQMKHDNNLALWAQVQAEEEGNEEWPRQLGA
ncbi:hypothetical protein [Brevibacterium sp. RIT 803]|uniref:hypothetical protein n=1 Tax=Brevibacterium sp. RIT 803 TaxID=2810210 RepID=UPI00194F25C7|nr:hypothetical protein [Brevibacterium sp. RIT 803]MBM6588801.1 hypothetical protein [Brevibacterium sp. RIT 803]